MKKIVCDFDDVICYNTMVDIVNKFLHTNYKMEDFIEGYDASSFVKDSKKLRALQKYILKKNIYKHATLIDGAAEVLKKLQEEHRYEIYICSACMLIGHEDISGPIFEQKYNYILKHLPFIKPQNVIFTSAKDMIHGDVMIDDRLVNLNGKFTTKILFETCYTKKLKKSELEKQGIVKVSNWKQIEKLLIKQK